MGYDCELFLRVVFAGWNFGWWVSHCGYVVACWFGFGFRYLLRVRLLLLVWFISMVRLAVCVGSWISLLGALVLSCWFGFWWVWLVMFLEFWWGVMVALGWLLAWCRLVSMGVLVLGVLMVGCVVLVGFGVMFAEFPSGLVVALCL